MPVNVVGTGYIRTAATTAILAASAYSCDRVSIFKAWERVL